jgi:hypothetical protein
MSRQALLTWVAIAGVVVAAGCGAGSPSSPSAGGTGVEVQGVVMGDGISFAASSGKAVSAVKAQEITVTVAGTTLTAQVSANGTFVLKNIPSGTFALVFMVDGKKIGEVVVTASDGDEVKIVVQVKDGLLTLLQIKVDSPTPVGSPSPKACIISGGTDHQPIELEGVKKSGTWQHFQMDVNGQRAGVLVDVDTLTLNATFRCIGGAKTDTVEECKALVNDEHKQPKVHVSGMLLCQADKADVTATEVKVQKD